MSFEPEDITQIKEVYYQCHTDNSKINQLTIQEQRHCQILFENLNEAKLNENILYKDSPQFKVSEITKKELELMRKYCADGFLTPDQLKGTPPLMLSLFASLELFDDDATTAFAQIDPTEVGSVSKLGLRNSSFLESIPLVYPLFNEVGFDEFHGSLSKFLIDANKAILKRVTITNATTKNEVLFSIIDFMLSQMIELMDWKEKQQGKFKKNAVPTNASPLDKSSNEVTQVTNPLNDLHNIVLTTLDFIFDTVPFENSYLKLIRGLTTNISNDRETYRLKLEGGRATSKPDILITKELKGRKRALFFHECKHSLISLRNILEKQQHEFSRLESIFKYENNKEKPYFHVVKDTELRNSYSKLHYIINLFRQISCYARVYITNSFSLSDISSISFFKIVLKTLQKIDLNTPFVTFDDLLNILKQNRQVLNLINKETKRIKKSNSKIEMFIDDQKLEKVAKAAAEEINFTNRKENVTLNTDTDDYNEDTAFPLKVSLVKWFIEHQVHEKLKDVDGYKTKNPGYLLESENDLRTFFNEKICFIPITTNFQNFEKQSQLTLQVSILGMISRLLKDNNDGLSFINNESLQKEFLEILGSLFRKPQSNT